MKIVSLESIDRKGERNKRILEMARRGIKYSQIAKMENISPQRVSQILISQKYIKRPTEIDVEKWVHIWNKQ